MRNSSWGRDEKIKRKVHDIRPRKKSSYRPANAYKGRETSDRLHVCYMYATAPHSREAQVRHKRQYQAPTPRMLGFRAARPVLRQTAVRTNRTRIDR